ncbi:hypothetical protein RJ639_000020 [Escallonia herrerae]|uniref:Uncharacterized protein n=1 Tax=Escallonia herrerae TaxID=1293975 RepID=A0AA88XAH7_9ASTE|nr:hypothetical protein RJ639_000020 [Escallonia herrerae]
MAEFFEGVEVEDHTSEEKKQKKKDKKKIVDGKSAKETATLLVLVRKYMIGKEKSLGEDMKVDYVARSMDRDPRNIPDLSNIMKGQSKRTFNRSDSGESSSTPPQIHIPQIQYPENVTAVTEPALKKLKIYDHEYSDFSDTTHGFNVIEKDQISRAQKVLIDNLWVAHKRNDRRHMIACLNDTVKMLIRSSPPTAKQIPAYVIYDGRIKGIFHSWAEVSYNTQSFKNAKFKKYTSLEEAYREASIYLTDGSHLGWGAVLIKKPDKLSPKSTEQICRFASGQYTEIHLSTIETKLLAISHATDSFELFILGKIDFTIRTDYIDQNSLNTAKNMQRIELELGSIRSQTTQIGQIVETLRQQHPISDMTSIDSHMKSIKKDTVLYMIGKEKSLGEDMKVDYVARRCETAYTSGEDSDNSSDNEDEDNLNITIGLLGKSSQNSNMQYKYNIEDVITAIRSKGVQFIEPPKYQPTEYADNLLEMVTKNIRDSTAEAALIKNIQICKDRLAECQKYRDLRISQMHTYFKDFEATSVAEKNSLQIKHDDVYHMFTQIKDLLVSTTKTPERSTVHVESIPSSSFRITSIEEECTDDEFSELPPVLQPTYTDDTVSSINMIDQDDEIRDFINFAGVDLALPDTDMNQNIETGEPSGSNPLEPPRYQPAMIEYPYGNIPPRQYKDYRDSSKQIKSFGKRMPIDGFEDYTLLQIGRYSPQLWPQVINEWKQKTIGAYLQSNFVHTPDQMFKYLETKLGSTAKNVWDNYKITYDKDFAALVALGANPYNFVNQVSQLLTASDPSLGSRYQQSVAVQDLEKLSITDWNHIIYFLTDFIHLTSVSQNTFNPDFQQKLLNKLPGPLDNVSDGESIYSIRCETAYTSGEDSDNSSDNEDEGFVNMMTNLNLDNIQLFKDNG